MNYLNNKNIFLERYKCIYFVLPKNGCSSMQAHIVNALEMEKGQNFPKDIHNSEIYPYPYVKKSTINNDFKDYLRFCIVRNPWSRLVSCYKDKIRHVGYNEVGFVDGVALPLKNNSPLFYGGMPFEEFVDVVCSINDAEGEHHFTSQLFQLTDESGNLYVNFIAKLETLQEDLKVITKTTNFSFNHFPHFHKSKSKPYTKYYTYELKEKVRKRFKKDIKFFRYSFGQMSSARIGFLPDKQKIFSFAFLEKYKSMFKKSFQAFLFL